jgi:PmbA protein
MSDPRNSQELLDFAERLVKAAKQAGADAADAVVARGSSVSVTVRLGKVEGTEASESDDFSLRVFSGQKVASISASAGSDPAALAERAVAMAKAAPEDEFQSLADRENLVRSPRDLDLFDATHVDAPAPVSAAWFL